MTIFELILPVLLCALLVLGSNLSEIDTFTSTDFVPASLDAVLGSFVKFPSPSDPSIPIVPLPLFLAFAGRYGIFSPAAVARSGSRYLAVSPRNAETERIVSTILGRPIEPWMLNTSGVLGQSLAGMFSGVPQVPDVTVRYFATSEAIDSAARDDEPIWAAIVFDRVPDATQGGQLQYRLRFTNSDLPPTRRLYDRFPEGRSVLYDDYFRSGFLSLQVRDCMRIEPNSTPDCASIATPIAPRLRR